MMEAEITCLCTSIQLPDLNLTLAKGMVVYLDADVARKSQDLLRAWRTNSAVSIKYVQRFRERRTEAPAPLPPGSFPPHVALPPMPPDPPQPEPSKGPVDVEALAQRVADILRPHLQQVVLEMGALRRDVQNLSLSGYAVPGVHSERHPIMGTVPDEVPVFIPSKIGRDDLQATLEVGASAHNEDVADAVAALKAARKAEKS